MDKSGQQEIVGFVLIVVLVMVGLMVFLIISVRDGGESVSGVRVSNMLDVIFKTSSGCAINYEPDYDSYGELFKSCFMGKDCGNLGISACKYLNDSLRDVVSSMILSDASVDGWSVDFFERDGAGILRWSGGNCSGRSEGAQRSVVSRGANLIVRMRLCRE